MHTHLHLRECAKDPFRHCCLWQQAAAETAPAAAAAPTPWAPLAMAYLASYPRTSTHAYIYTMWHWLASASTFSNCDAGTFHFDLALKLSIAALNPERARAPLYCP